MSDADTPSEQPLWNPGPNPGPNPSSPSAPAPPRSGGARPPREDGWVSGLVLFGGVVMLVDGVFGILRGIMGIANDSVFVNAPNYVFHFDLTAWGWIHLVLGVLLVVVGYGVLKGAAWGRAAGIAIASLSAVGNMMALPYYPLWSLIAVALDIAVVWALCVYRSDRAY